MDWVAIFQQAGFPVLVAIGLAIFTRDQLKREQKRSDEREAAMALRIQHLEDRIEKTLIGLVEETRDTVADATIVMKNAISAFGIGKDTRGKIKALAAEHSEHSERA